jgi:tetratricopeptide (TPR) repeat protein
MSERRDERAARARLALGLLLYDINKDECAAEVLRAGLSYAPDMVEAYVALGFIYARLIQYEEMLGAFGAALRLDPQTARRAAVEEPEEIRQIQLIFYPVQAASAATADDWSPGLPSEIREAWELVEVASEHIRTGRDIEAVEALERAVRLDSASAHPTALLIFAYLLLARNQQAVWAGRSVLWTISPWLARLIFQL